MLDRIAHITFINRNYKLSMLYHDKFCDNAYFL